MDKGKLMRSLIIVVLAFVMVCAVILISNWDMVSRKFGIKPAEPTVTNGEEAALNESKQIGDNLSAFLEDETFFDEESHYKSIEVFAGKSVYMIMNSVAKDLRIMIVDSVGDIVTGAPFCVSIQDVGDYTDDDMDGIIYIPALRSGEYSVMLNELDGFRVPNTITSIKIKDRIEYRAIDDISYLIVDEATVDSEKEDTEIRDAEEEATEQENTELSTTNAGKVGIDVSKWNEEIDWEQVAGAGIEYAIIRVGYRGSSTGAIVEDPHFKMNIEGAIDAGIPVGVYFFTQAVSETEAVEEASAVLSLIKGYDVDYPVFIDSESAGGRGRADSLNEEDRTAYVKAFLETIKNAGYAAGIYGSTNWYNDKLDMNKLSDYYLWLAEYDDAPSYDGYYHMWQYTSKGHVDGIATAVDFDISYMNIDTQIDHSEQYSGVVNGDTGNVPTQ